MRSLHPSSSITIYIRHPPADGRDWCVSQVGQRDRSFDSEEAARNHALEWASIARAEGQDVELRIEGADGVWRSEPFSGPVDEGEGEMGRG